MSTKIFAILHKPTGRFESFGSKCAWLTTGAAKNAWACHVGYKFDNQHPVVYEIVDLTEAYYRLEGLDK